MVDARWEEVSVIGKSGTVVVGFVVTEGPVDTVDISGISGGFEVVV